MGKYKYVDTRKFKNKTDYKTLSVNEISIFNEIKSLDIAQYRNRISYIGPFIKIGGLFLIGLGFIFTAALSPEASTSYMLLLGILLIITAPIYYITSVMFFHQNKEIINIENTHKKVMIIFTAIQKEKNQINNLYKELLYFIKLDNKELGIKAKEVIEIKEHIQEITAKIQEYRNSLKNIGKQRQYDYIFRYPSKYISLVNLLIDEENSELISLIKDFTTSIQSWTKLHQKELLEVEQELEKQVATTESLSGQGAIDLQRVRLHEHIENLNKITNTL